MRTTGVVVLLAMATHAALAGPEEDRAKAQELFKQGRELQKAGDEEGGCAKFRDALELDKNAIGVILNVARCEEQAGKVATAARLYEDARARAREQQEPDSPLLRTAGDHIDQLKPEIPYLAIVFAEQPSADTVLTVNGEPIAVSQAGHVPVDPGAAKVVVSRPGRVPFETKVEVAKREQKGIIVPALALPVVMNHRQRTIGKIMVTSGAGLVVGGIVAGLIANSVYHTAYKDGRCTTSGGVALCPVALGEEGKVNSMVSLGNASTFIVAAGGIAVVAGAYLWLFSMHEQHVALAPEVGSNYAGFVAGGRF